jgi:hypothetical protein
MQPLYPIAAAAELTGRHPAFIRRLCRTGALSAAEAVKPGSEWLLTEVGMARLRDWPRVGWRKGRARRRHGPALSGQGDEDANLH